MNEVLVRRVRLPVPAATAFAWHERPGAFERLAPPWERVEVVERSGGIRDGASVVLRAGPFGSTWRLRHAGYVAGRRFEDIQAGGPFARWHHVHEFHDAPGGCELEDRIEYGLPGGAPGRAVAGAWVRERLDRTFDYRHRVLRDDLAAHAAAGGVPLRVAITGAGGLLGSSLSPFLTAGGHEVVRIVRRRPAGPGEVSWDPARGVDTPAALEGFDAVVHLAGVGIADARWTPRRRRAIEDSRVAGTRSLCAALASLAKPPRVLIAASAVGYYGSRGDELLREDSSCGAGFLAGLARRWEGETAAAERAGIRVVRVRTGLVLTPRGGMLGALLLPFRFGAGGPVADGKSWWSWIALDDWIGLVHFALTRDGVSGPWNAVGPAPVRNRDFAVALGRALHRPALLPAPRFALEWMFGEMARETILASQRVEPAAALGAGYRFLFPDLDGALGHLLGVRPSEVAGRRGVS